MKPLKRHDLHNELVRHLRQPEKILVVEGVRQTGKTTAIQMALAGMPHTFVTLSDEDFPIIQLREAASFDEFTRELYRHFGWKAAGGTPLVIDEAQRSTHLYGFIMQMAREWPNVPVILSGSVMGAFFTRPENKKVVSPAGRVRTLVCRPFSFFEFLEWVGEAAVLEELQTFHLGKTISASLHNRATALFYEYMTCGGFPEAIAHRHSTEQLYTYFQTLLSFFWQDADRYLTEILESEKYQYGSLMQVIFKAVALHTTSATKRSTLLSTDSPAYRLILPGLLDAMERWHFLFRLPTEMNSMTTKQGFSSKKYLWDVGIVNHFINLSRPADHGSDPVLFGKLLETYVAQELVGALKTVDRLGSWKSQQKQTSELDFIAHFPLQDIPVEVKASRNMNQKAISQLREYVSRHPHGRYFVVYMGECARTMLGDKPIWWIPPYLLPLIDQKEGV